ncbi:MAG: ATP-binding protein, partial [Gaiellaceae bacterium]
MRPSVERGVLPGRGAELEVLSACLEQAASGRLQTVLVEGEAGIGKTRLLEAGLERARGRGFRTFAGRSDEVERGRPFGPLSDALGCTHGMDDPRRVEIVRLLTWDQGSPEQIELTRDPGVQFRLVDAFVGLVEEAAFASPVALALEDLHWADPSTVVTFRSLARRLTYLPVALVATLRPVPRAPELDVLVDALARDGAQRIALGPLPEGAITRLVADLVRAEPGPSLLEQVAGAAGNPLFIGELVKALDEEGAIHLVNGRAEVHNVSLPPSLRLTILRRLSFLEEEALELLRVASAFGSIFSLRDVATVLDRSATELLQPVRMAIHAGVLEERDARLGFRHDLIREVIYADLPEDARAALHLEAGRRLAQARAPALQVAEQFTLGAQPGDTDAVEWLHTAAHETARRSPAVAVELLERALDLEDRDDRRIRLLADLVPTLLWSGKPQEAEARAREALAAPAPPDLEGTFRLGLVSALTAQGRAEDVIDEARNATRTSLSADVCSELQAEAANALAFADQIDLAEQAAHEAVTLGAPVQSEGAAMGMLVLCDLARVRGAPEEALALVEEARALAAARSASRLRWPPEVFLAMSLHQLDRFEEAHEALREGQRADERLGNVSYLPVYHYEAASLLFSAGRWEDAIAQAHAGLGLADEVGLEMLLPWPHGVLAVIAVRRDELEAAATSLAVLESRHGAEPAALARGLLAEALGDPAGALTTL